jgi:hypothetical protein
MDEQSRDHSHVVHLREMIWLARHERLAKKGLH